MQQILIACGDLELLRKIVRRPPDRTPSSRSPPRPVKASPRRSRAETSRSPSSTNQFADDTSSELLGQLVQLDDGPSSSTCQGRPALVGPFERALRYPVPGPVLRNAIKAVPASAVEHDLEKWRLFYRELKARLEKASTKSPISRCWALAEDVPHHRLQKAYDVLSKRYHPDRYNQISRREVGEGHPRAVDRPLQRNHRGLRDSQRPKAALEIRTRARRGTLRLDSEDMPTDSRGPKSLESLGKTSKLAKIPEARSGGYRLRQCVRRTAEPAVRQSMEPNNRDIAEKIEDVRSRRWMTPRLDEAPSRLPSRSESACQKRNPTSYRALITALIAIPLLFAIIFLAPPWGHSR